MRRRNHYQPVPQSHRDYLIPLQRMDDQAPRNLKRLSVSAENYSNRKRRRRARRSEIPPNVHGNDWREMVEISAAPSTQRKRTISRSQGSLIKDDRTASKSSIDGGNDRPKSQMSIAKSVQEENQITNRFKCRECTLIVPSNRNPDKCGCGRLILEHDTNSVHVDDYQIHLSHTEHITWSINQNCRLVPTNAYGTIEFEGGPHPVKAQYLRLSFDTDPADIVAHIQKVWKIEAPRLVVTVHGGMTNFPLQPKLARAFRKGLVKAAGIDGAWIITSGIDSCTTNHVTEALYGSSFKFRSKPITIGIAPWGLLKKRGDLIGTDKIVSYYRGARRADDGLVELNRRHSFFLLVDNGTVGRYGADIFLRRRLESYIAEKQTLDIGSRRVPVVCVALEGGRSTIRSVLDYVTKSPKVPVVICDGSGRASDLIAFAHKRFKEEGELRGSIREQLLGLIKDVFGYDAKRARTLISELAKIAAEKSLTIFRLGEGSQDLDNAILTALLKGQNLTAIEQLTLALAWNRADVARSDIFIMGQDWPKKALYTAMMDALIHNRVDFVRLLLENGVSMKDFLTITRLENLYNSSHGPKNTLSFIVDDVVKAPYDRYELPFIGLAIEKLMGNGFRASYTSQAFRTRYEIYRKTVLDNQHRLNTDSNNHMLSTVSTSQIPLDQGVAMVPPLSGNRALSNHLMWRSANRNGFTNRLEMATIPDSVVIDFEDENESITQRSPDSDFDYPFSDLLIWAILSRRHELALCMWEHGEEAMAKSLVACRLYKSLAKEASEDYLDLDLCEELRKQAESFRELSVQLLDHCYQNDEMRTLELLTYEMSNWGRETSLTLAIIVNNKQFIAHPCCQALLADLWHGGMRIRTNTNLKVIAGLFFPPSLILIDFKSAEELKRQPQTAAEHADDSDSDINGSVGSGSRSSSSTSSSSSSSSDESVEGPQNVSVRRRVSSSSGHSAHFGLFRSRRKRHKSTTVAIPEHKSIDDENKMTMSNPSPRPNELRPPVLKTTSLSVPQLYMLEKPRRYTARLQINDAVKTSDLAANELDPPALNNNTINSKTPAKRPKNTNLKKFTFTNKWAITKDEKIKFRRRVYEFFVAPITTFWSWTISFVIFLSLFTYVLLIKTPVYPTVFEWYLFAYVVGFGMEIIRKLFMSDPKKFKEKLAFFFLNYWNALTFVAIIMFIIGFILRLYPHTRSAGRVVLATNSMLWSIKLLDFLSVHPRFGPYVTMAGKMISSMSNIVVMLGISLLAFGLTRQSITYPNEEWSWLLLRNVFYKPYFMLYGEVYADEIDTCGDDAWDEHLEKKVPVDELTPSSNSCVPGYWVPPLLMTIFLLIANILLISMLIAIFNNIFDTANKISHQIWLFQRYRQVMEYQNASILPPPFTPFYHLHLVYKYLKFRYRMKREQLYQTTPTPGSDPKKWQRAERRRKQKVRLLREQLFDSTLKLFFNPDQVEKIHDFEEECMESLAREKEYQSSRTNDERLYRTCERSEQVLQKVNDIGVKDDVLKENVRTLDSRMDLVEAKQNEMLDLLRNLNNALSGVFDKMAVDSRLGENFHYTLHEASLPIQANKIEEPEDRKAKESSQETNSAAQLSQPTFITKQRSRSHLENTEPTSSSGLRSRTTTIGGDSAPKAMGPIRQNSMATYGSLISINRNNKIPNIRAKPSFRSSVKRPMTSEYTSITDGITVETQEATQFLENAGEQISPTIGHPEPTNEEEEDGFSDAPSQSASIHSLPDGSHNSIASERFDIHSSIDDSDDGILLKNRVPTPTTTLKRAKDSFIRHQNVILKSYEEEIGNDDKANDSDSPNEFRRHSDPPSPREAEQNN